MPIKKPLNQDPAAAEQAEPKLEPVGTAAGDDAPAPKRSLLPVLIPLFIVLLAALSYVAFGNKSSKPQTPVQEAPKAAEAKISKVPVLLSQDGNLFRLQVNLENKYAEKRIIKYAVALYKADAEGKVDWKSVADAKSYEGGIEAGPGSGNILSKEISYSAPEFLDGNYALVIDYVTEGGDFIDSYKIGTYALKKQTDSLEILADTCFLLVEGDKKNTVYSLNQGIDIKPNENLLLTCSVKNSSNGSVAANINFQNFRRNVMLGETAEQIGMGYGTVSFEANETKNISAPIARALKPQAYDASFFLTDGSQKRISNSVFAHYVLDGESASLLDVRLDKASYAGGDKANITVDYGSSADGFEGSRGGGTANKELALNIEVRDGDNVSCLSHRTVLDAASSTVVLPLAISKECKNAYVAASLAAKYGEILDRRTFNAE